MACLPCTSGSILEIRRKAIGCQSHLLRLVRCRYHWFNISSIVLLVSAVMFMHPVWDVGDAMTLMIHPDALEAVQVPEP